MINHNLRIADGRWYGKSVVLRKEAARNEERARPPSTYILGDAMPESCNGSPKIMIGPISYTAFIYQAIFYAAEITNRPVPPVVENT